MAIRALCFSLALQIGLGPTLLSANTVGDDPERNPIAQAENAAERLREEGRNDPATIEGLRAADAFIAETEADRPGEFPSKPYDTFRLTGQRLDMIGGKEAGQYDLGSFRVELPVVVADFDRRIQVEADRDAKELAIVHVDKDGAAIARHVLTGVDVVAFAHDREMLQFVEADGRMHVIDMIYARGAAFRGPLPVFHVGNLPEGALDRGRIGAAFGTRGLRPPTVVPDEAVLPQDPEYKNAAAREIWRAGDFVVFADRADGKRELIGVFSRGVSQMQMYTGNAVVAFLATLVSPPHKPAAAKPVLAALGDPLVAAEAGRAGGELDRATREALAGLPEQATSQLLARAVVHRDRATSQRDRYEYAEWVRDFKAVKERAEREHRELTEQENAKEKERIRQLEEGLKSGDLGGEWQATVEAVLGKGTPQKRGIFYRVMHSKAMKYLAFFAGGYLAIKGIGVAADYPVTADAPWVLAKTVQAANWLYANVWPDVLKDAAYRNTLFKSFFALSAFLPALHIAGVIYGKMKGWPAIKAKAVMGIRAYAMIQLPFWVRLARLARQPNLMPALQLGLNPFAKIDGVRPGVIGFSGDRKAEIQKKRAVLEAVAMRKNRVRAYSWVLASAVVAERHGMDPATILAAQSGGFVEESLNREWLKVARELAVVFQDLKHPEAAAELAELEPGQVLEDYRIAKETAEKIEARSGLRRLAAALRLRWKEFGARAARGFGSYGIEENRFLTHVDPSRQVVDAAWQQFFADYLLTTFQTGLVGERADLAHPERLAAKADGILYTNEGHFADMVDMAIRSYGLQNAADLALVFQKDTFPAETRYAPAEHINLAAAPRMDSFVAGVLNWSKELLNVRKGDYGGLFLKTFVKKIKTLQAVFVLSMAARLGLAGQTVANALTGWTYLLFIAMPLCGWLWIPVTHANEAYLARIEAQEARFVEVRTRLAQAVRLGDREQTERGREALLKFYGKRGTPRVPEGLDAAALVEFSGKHPPYSMKPNRLIPWLSTAATSIATTYLSVALYATSYGHEFSPGMLSKAIGTAALFYGGTMLAQKLINKLSARIRAAKENSGSLETSGEGYLEAKARQFGVSPVEVAKAGGQQLCEILLRRR